MEKEKIYSFIVEKQNDSLDSFCISLETSMTDAEIIKKVKLLTEEIEKKIKEKDLSESELFEVNNFLNVCRGIIQDKVLNSPESFNNRLRMVIKIFNEK